MRDAVALGDIGQIRVSNRHLGVPFCTAAIAGIAALGLSSAGGLPAQSEARKVDRVRAATAATRPPRTRPLSDAEAAQLVVRSAWEPRPRNHRPNARRPSQRKLRSFRRHSRMPYKRFVTGGFRGTTDEILQWGAHKWGLSPDVLRAVATVESWWHQHAVGDEGRSFGLMQLKRPYHCCFPMSRLYTAFNVDYYAAYLRTVYDGRQRWLNRKPRGRAYRRGDLWGSVGVWYSGRWRHRSGAYVVRVKDVLRKRTWRRSAFAGGA